MTTIEELPWTFGEVLAKTRNMAGLSAQDMADRLHVHRNTISNWERGKTLPSHTDLIVWAQITNVPVGLLESSQGWMSPDGACDALAA